MAFLFLLTALLLPQNSIDGFVPGAYKKHGGMPYRLFIPQGYSPEKKYPIVIWLHGAGSAGTDNIGQISLDNKVGTHFWARPENQQKHPAFVLAPQSKAGWDNNESKGLSGELKQVLDILDIVRKTYSIDEARMYIAGQSNGGIGTWGLITKKPGLFAAAVPLCGAGNPKLAARAIGTAVWAFQGAKDDTIPPEYSRSMIAAMKLAGGTPRYTEYKDLGHEIWDRVFQEPELEDWLFAQHK
ncbi:MAG TPA: prolyl oligopeptidase family serine peptidase [Terriglobia bacterium]|jgi:predicted peptidase